MTEVTSGKISRALMAFGAILVVGAVAFLLLRTLGTNDETLDADLARVLDEAADAHREYAAMYISPPDDLERLQRKTDLTIPEGIAVTLDNDFGSFCLEATKPSTGETAHLESSVNEPEPGRCEDPR